jgi:hypothetical protein
VKRLVCLLRGHVPLFRIHSGWSVVGGGFLVPCERCGHVYEEKVRRI